MAESDLVFLDLAGRTDMLDDPIQPLLSLSFLT